MIWRRKSRYLCAKKWGHPAWHPDSGKIIERGNVFFDIDNGGKMIRMPGLPNMTDHPSVAPMVDCS